MTARTTLATADAAEGLNIGRYLRQRRLAADIVQAVRRADAVMRLEQSLHRHHDVEERLTG